MPQINPYASLANHASTLRDLWASDSESLQDAIELANRNLDLMKAVVEIAEKAPALLAEHQRKSAVTRRKKAAKKTFTPRVAVEKRATNVGTTEAIMQFLAGHSESTTREVFEGVTETVDANRATVSATLAMLEKRGRLRKTKKDDLNRYSVNE